MDTRTRALRLIPAPLVLGLVVSAATPVPARQADPGQVKAAFVLNFLKFVEWPAAEAQRGALMVAVLGDQSFTGVLSRAAEGQTVQGRRVSVRAAREADDLGGAHLIFIAASQARNLAAILRELEGRAVLTVGDTDGYAEAGVMLNLYTFDQRVRIEANTTAAARAGMRLSSQLLRLARIVG
jgi:hypothetical protein